MGVDYGHGDDLHKYHTTEFKANFSSNVWYKGAPKSLKNYLAKKVEGIENYPAPNAEESTKIIEKHHKTEPNSILITNGATEAFYLITNTFHGTSVTICNPTFSEYELASRVNKLTIEYIDRKAILGHIFTTKIAFICNPNNPDGTETTPEEIEQLILKFPETIFIIDEAYIEFSSSSISCISLLKKYKNIIVIKSVTKLFCIPGLRLGYVISNPKLIKKIGNHKMPWNVNSLALYAANFIFNNYKSLYPDFKTYFTLTSNLKKSINNLNGFSVLPTNTTYFLIRLDKPVAKELKLHLVNQHQLLVRNAANFNNLDEHYIRVATQTSEKNQLLLNALQQWTF